MLTAAAAAPERDRLSYARELVKFHEGFRSRAYQCAGDPPTKWTVGFGHCSPEVHRGTVVSRETAERYLDADLRHAAAGVAAAVKVPLTEAQFGALISFTYNEGVGAFQDSTLLFKINQRRFLSAAEQFGRWVFAGDEKLAGLSKRRAAERALFLTGVKQ